MDPGTYDIPLITAGASYRRQIALTDDVLAALPLGPEARMEIRKKRGAYEDEAGAYVSINEVSSEDGQIDTSDYANGIYQIYISAAGTSKLGRKTMYYDIFTEYASGDVDCVLTGKVTVGLNVTEPSYD